MPNKNFRQFAGGDGLAYRAAIEGLLLNGKVIVSTDKMDVGEWRGRVTIHLRPNHLARDSSSMWDVLADIGKTYGWTAEDKIVLLQPSSIPLASDHDRHKWVKAMLHWKTACSAWRVPLRWHPSYCMDPDAVAPQPPPVTRQSLTARFRPNGLFYILDGRTAVNGTFWESHPAFIPCDCHNIDTWEDWERAEKDYA